MRKYTFKDKQINNIIWFWLDMGIWDLVETENGLYLDDLQDEEMSRYVTEQEVINMIIELLELKMMEYEEIENDWSESLEILKSY